MAGRQSRARTVGRRGDDRGDSGAELEGPAAAASPLAGGRRLAGALRAPDALLLFLQSFLCLYRQEAQLPDLAGRRHHALHFGDLDRCRDRHRACGRNCETVEERCDLRSRHLLHVALSRPAAPDADLYHLSRSAAGGLRHQRRAGRHPCALALLRRLYDRNLPGGDREHSAGGRRKVRPRSA